MTLVSVIIPTHNRVNPLVRAIDSALSQTHRKLEVIIVDDGSTDDTRDEMARRYGDDPRVTYDRQVQGGVARARNRGLEIARGDAVACLDSDDVWRPWKLALQLDCLRRVPAAGMVWTDMHAVDSGGMLIEGSSLSDILGTWHTFGLDELFDERIPLAELPSTPAALYGHSLHVGDIFAKMAIGNLVLPSAALITRTRLERVGHFDESMRGAGEDFDFFLRICREGVVAYADVPSVLYQVGQSDQLTHSSRKLHLARNYLRTMDAAFARHPERMNLPPAIVRAAYAYGLSWTGRAYLEAGNVGAARIHLRRALRLHPRDGRTLAFAALALLPGPLSSGVVRLARRVVLAIRRRRSTS